MSFAFDQSVRSSVASTVTVTPSVFFCSGSFTLGVPFASNVIPTIQVVERGASDL